MGTNKSASKPASRSKGASAGFIILGCAIIAFSFFIFVAGDPSGFDDKGNPKPGNWFAILYTGGYVIPIVITLLLTVLSLSVERMFALNRASGKGKIAKFVIEAKAKLANGDIDGASKLCDEQKGSVANILKAGLVRYKDVEAISGMTNDQKAAIIQGEIEEATTLELPYLEKNLNIIAAISSLGTLFGLLGTVLGMIKSFQAMSQAGSPDSTKLALGISEALMNTAMGIGTGAAAIISYTYFSGRVTNMTNAVDEVGFAIGQTYTDAHGGITK